MAISPQTLTNILQSAFTGAEIILQDLAGDGDHYKVKIISDQFEGLSRVKRHQLVYRALDETLKSKLHALSIQTLTPNEEEN